MAAHTGPLITGNTLDVDTTAGGVEVVGETAYHKTLTIVNIDSSNAIFIGGNSGLTAANGYRIAAGEAFSIDLHPLAVVHAISGGSVEARFLVTELSSSF